MGNRVALIGIMLEDVNQREKLNTLLTRREQEIPHLYRWRDELR